MVSYWKAPRSPRACSISSLNLGNLCQIPMEDLGVLLAQRVHICCVPHPLPVGGGVAIPSGMVHVTPCRVTWCGGDQHQVLDHTIEAMVAKEEMNLLFLQSEGPEKVALKEDSQMEEGTLVGVLLEMVGIISTKPLAVAWG